MKIYFRIFRVVLLFNYQGSRSLSDLFYTDISLSVLLTCCLRQRYIFYHFVFSLSRTFLFYFFKFFSVVCFSNSDIISCLQFPVNTFFIFFSTLFNQFFVVCRKKSASFRSGFIISLFFLRVKHYFTFFYIFFYMLFILLDS